MEFKFDQVSTRDHHGREVLRELCSKHLPWDCPGTLAEMLLPFRFQGNGFHHYIVSCSPELVVNCFCMS